MSSTSLYFLSRDVTKKFCQSYFDRLDNTYQGFTRLTGNSIRLFNYLTDWIKTKLIRKIGSELYYKSIVNNPIHPLVSENYRPKISLPVYWRMTTHL